MLLQNSNFKLGHYQAAYPFDIVNSVDEDVVQLNINENDTPRHYT